MALTGPEGLLKALTKTVIETALDEEVADQLGYDKHDPAGRNGQNSRNGKRTKTVLTDNVGPIEIEVPRDRAGTFDPQLVKKRQRRLGGVDTIVSRCPPRTTPRVRRLRGQDPRGAVGRRVGHRGGRRSLPNLSERDGRELPVEEAVAQGHVKSWPEGEKFTGGLALTRNGGGERPRWLLVKLRDDRAERQAQTGEHSTGLDPVRPLGGGSGRRRRQRVLGQRCLR